MHTPDLSSCRPLASVPSLFGTGATLAGLVLAVLPLVARELRRPSLTAPVRVVECFGLAYSAPIADASPAMFPGTVALFPGSDSAAVASGASPADRIGFWRMFLRGARWRSLGRDSVELWFSDGFAGIGIRASRRPTELSGRATFYSDAVAPGPMPSMRVRGHRLPCPSAVPANESLQLTEARRPPRHP